MRKGFGQIYTLAGNGAAHVEDHSCGPQLGWATVTRVELGHLLEAAMLAKCVSTTANETIERVSRNGRQRLSLIHRLAERVSSGISLSSFSKRRALGIKYAKDQTRTVKCPTKAVTSQMRKEK